MEPYTWYTFTFTTHSWYFQRFSNKKFSLNFLYLSVISNKGIYSSSLEYSFWKIELFPEIGHILASFTDNYWFFPSLNKANWPILRSLLLVIRVYSKSITLFLGWMRSTYLLPLLFYLSLAQGDLLSVDYGDSDFCTCQTRTFDVDEMNATIKFVQTK